MSDEYNLMDSYFDDIDRWHNMQEMINALIPWRFEACVAQSMMEAIECGACLFGTKSTIDYHGNYIPSRDELQAYTPGSYEYVLEHYGKRHADAMAEVDDG